MRLALAVAAALLVTAGVAEAGVAEPESYDPMKTPPEETIYATEHHLGFSVRSTIIRWLGGVPITDEHDLRASARERWWGDEVPILPAVFVKGRAR
jgi:hypothetical protein